MARIARLDVDRLRNLSGVRLEPSERINIVHGDNGSGKTSLLEAIHFLGLGRSFRDKRVDPVIRHDASDCVLYAALTNGRSIGLQKTRRQGHTLKFGGEKQTSWREIAEHLPVQILNAESFALLEGGARARRRFLDWGVFHVEHQFVDHWRAAARCLAQRNLLLKQPAINQKELEAWDTEFAQHADFMHGARSRYFESFLSTLKQTAAALLPDSEISFEYTPGWDTGQSLLSVLQDNLARDRRYGATQRGPHRADLRVRTDSHEAASIFSRGQQKLLVSAMKIAQGRFLAQLRGKTGVYLVDDLPAELDRVNRRRVCQLLVELDSQIFFTCVDPQDLKDMWQSDVSPAKFHVEHGKIEAV